MPTVSIVIPCFNNADVLAQTVEGITDAAGQLKERGVSLSLILVDDASTDGTWQAVRQLRDSAGIPIVGLLLGRNVGAYRAIVVGMNQAKGDAVIVMAADGDDPPTLIPEMVDRWLAGDRLVQAARESARGSMPDRIFGGLYYAMLRMLGTRNLPAHGSDFMLADRENVDSALHRGFLPGNTLIQLYQHADRAAVIPYAKGNAPGSGWGVVKKADLFLNGILTATGLPWPFLMLLSALPPMLLWGTRPYDLPCLITETEVTASAMLLLSWAAVLRYAIALRADPPQVVSRA